jgi:hypothetical protein
MTRAAWRPLRGQSPTAQKIVSVKSLRQQRVCGRNTADRFGDRSAPLTCSTDTRSTSGPGVNHAKFRRLTLICFRRNGQFGICLAKNWRVDSIATLGQCARSFCIAA